ncbi:MAG: PEGA domain-containing protein, partial [Patescibacteria group bacterium]
IGQTPYSGDNLKPGRKTVKLVPETPNEATYETTLTLSGGNITVMTWTFGKTLDESGGEVFELSKATNKNKNELSIVTNPDNIIVKVDGQTKGLSPLILDDLAEGLHSLTVTAPGYVERTSNPKLVKGYRLTVTSKLAREPFGGAINATPSATPVTSPSPIPKTSPKPTPRSMPTTNATSSGTTTGVISASIKTLPYVEIIESGTGWLRVRDSADGNAQELTKLSVGSTVPYMNETLSGWLKVEYQTGKQGWVSGKYAVVHQ